MAATPLGQLLFAVATYCTCVATFALFAGAMTCTWAALPLTTMVIGVALLPPQLSHSWTTVWYVPGLRVKSVLSPEPLTVYASTLGAV